jgi:hypothetical protein
MRPLPFFPRLRDAERWIGRRGDETGRIGRGAIFEHFLSEKQKPGYDCRHHERRQEIPASRASALLGAREGLLRRDRAFNWRPQSSKKLFLPGGSSQPLEKAHFGQGNQRESKPFPWKNLAGFGAGLARL